MSSRKKILLGASGIVLIASLVVVVKSQASSSELDSIAQALQTKVLADKTEADCAAELSQFDALAARQGTNTEAATEILEVKVRAYLQLFNDSIKARDVVLQIKTNYPASQFGQRADEVIASLEPAIKLQTIRDALVPGIPFPDFNEKDLNSNSISVGALKGKEVLVDFWATWCLPCRAELPNVITTYKKYHGQGLDIIGISLDSGRADVDKFLKEQPDMTWPEFCGGQGFDSPVVSKYGINAIPFSILVGRDGKIIATNLRGEALGNAVEKALAKK